MSGAAAFNDRLDALALRLAAVEFAAVMDVRTENLLKLKRSFKFSSCAGFEAIASASVKTGSSCSERQVWVGPKPDHRLITPAELVS